MLDVAGWVAGIGLAVAGFVVVILVSVVVLRLLGVVLSGSDADQEAAATAAEALTEGEEVSGQPGGTPQE